MIPGSPSSSASTSPGVPPPGLKSLQTTPVIPPESASGTTACTASAGTSEVRITRQAKLCDVTGGERLLEHEASRSALPAASSVDGCAAERTPEGDTASFTTAIAALTVPWEGPSRTSVAR